MYIFNDYLKHIDDFILCSYPCYLRDALFNVVTNSVMTVGPPSCMGVLLEQNNERKLLVGTVSYYNIELKLNDDLDYDQLVIQNKKIVQHVKYKCIEEKYYMIPKTNYALLRYTLLCHKKVIVWYDYLTHQTCKDISLVILHFYLTLLRKDKTLYIYIY